MKKLILLLIIICNTIFLFSTEIPTPRNGNLYTEFTFERTSPMLSRSIQGRGLIVMKGARFLYRQISPNRFDVRNVRDKIYLFRNNEEPVELPPNGGDSIFFLFTGTPLNTLGFTATIETTGNLIKYRLTPTTPENKMREIYIEGLEDKIYSIRIKFEDESIVSYRFTNTITGAEPDERFFRY